MEEETANTESEDGDIFIYTIENNMYQKNVVVPHKVISCIGEPGERIYKCGSTVSNIPYVLEEKKTRIYSTMQEATADL